MFPPVTTRPEQSDGGGGDVVLDRLRRLHPKRIDLSLGRMERLLQRLGHPEQKLPAVVHIAGTNGKGSTTAYMKAALEAAGYGVHVYTSPHLVRFHERIVLAGEGPISDADLIDILIECEAANGEAPITYFEVTTAAAFLAFSRRSADVILLEVGLGGRLDATNVIEHPVLCVLTPISIDHVQFLGDAVTDIAFEKAGILKPGVPCVVAAQDEAVMAVIESRAAELGAPLIKSGAAWDVRVLDTGGLEVSLNNQKTALPSPALPGGHQFANAGLAVAALKSLPGFKVGDDALALGLTAACWPGRLQRLDHSAYAALLPDQAELWLDGGHNAAAGAALAETVRAWGAADQTPRPLYLVVGMMNVKDVTAFLSAFQGRLEAVVGIEIPGEVNTLSGAEICRHAREAGFRALPADDPGAAMSIIRADCTEGAPPRVLICGSLYLAGSILAAEQGAAKMAGEMSG